MKTLLLMRHAKSSWKHDVVDDHDRPLNERGKKEAPRMGQMLRSEDLLPELIVSSDAKRCRRTAEKLAVASQYIGETILTRELYLAPPASYLKILARLPDHFNRVLLLGHNPGIEELLEALTGRYEPMSTASLAHLDFTHLSHWSEIALQPLEVRLVKFWQPMEIA